MKRRALLGLPLAAALVVAAPTHAAGAKRPPEPRFGPFTSGMYVGMQTETLGAFCTANFVFVDAAADLYFGQSAHCARKTQKEVASPTGCTFGSHPLGTPVLFPDSNVTGKLAYSSWLTMQKVGEKDQAACVDNDFALVKVPRFAHNQVNPTMPLFYGPTGVNTEGTMAGDTVVGFGNSPTRQGLSDIKPKQSVAVGTVPGGWAHLIYSATPGIPGDSGGPYLDERGRALGSLSKMVLGPAPAANVVTDIHRALDYARKHSGIEGLRLAEGTEKFRGAFVGNPLLQQVPQPVPPAARTHGRRAAVD